MAPRNHPIGVQVEVVGFLSGTRGRSCEEHSVCGCVVDTDTVLRLRSVVIMNGEFFFGRSLLSRCRRCAQVIYAQLLLMLPSLCFSTNYKQGKGKKKMLWLHTGSLMGSTDVGSDSFRDITCGIVTPSMASLSRFAGSLVILQMSQNRRSGLPLHVESTQSAGFLYTNGSHFTHVGVCSVPAFTVVGGLSKIHSMEESNTKPIKSNRKIRSGTF